MSNTVDFSAEEIQLYDRQLRLWGVQSQKRLVQSKVILLGFNNLQAEVCKNIVLAGLKHLTIIDWVVVSENNAVPHLFLDLRDSIGHNRVEAASKWIQTLNPYTEIKAVAVSSEELGVEKTLEIIGSKEYDLLCVSGIHSQSALVKLSEACHQSSPPESHFLCPNSKVKQTLPFIVCQSSGFIAHFFLDLGDYAYTSADAILTKHYAGYKHFLDSNLICQTTPQQLALRVISEYEKSCKTFPLCGDKKLEEEIKQVSELYSFSTTHPDRNDYIQKYILNFETEVSAVTALVGGFIGQEVIKILTACEPLPFNNFFVFDGVTGSNYVVNWMSEKDTQVGPVADDRTLPPQDRKPILTNIVATGNLAVPLDLKLIARSAKNTEYKPRRFAAVTMRLTNPTATVLVFHSGKLVCTGAKDEQLALITLQRCGAIIKHIQGPPIKLQDFKVHNVVAYWAAGFPIRLEALQDEHYQFCHYEPEIFPGLIYRMADPKVSLLIFVSGRIVFTGAKSHTDIIKAWNLIYSVLVRFRKF